MAAVTYSLKSSSFAALALPDELLATAEMASATKEMSIDRSSSRSSPDASERSR
eukprot:CAMPEP_0172564006 /NCGR_PEP_ID=MMETSP1067-20121228/102670_1 /TAXON_ID=265564 ORGANISM="Thalassiosira punctigera, Strain Tpunct2005C2" /NCGR_SAMPLE_ID=MMETSP1067 /ASSEMBLY_ACC=CAM_ASM_000444 /LENGTH=53 /DNA_ID=CAMNT_0013354573 /DNA_START=46 /DNA_END=203 /DNA_ORIENTATION=+